MTRSCCVVGCRSRHGRSVDEGIRFFRFPTWKRSHGPQLEEITKRRRMAWLSAVRRKDLIFNKTFPHMCVCSRHFHKGEPAYEMMESDPDWAPSLHLGHASVKPTDPGRSARRRAREQTRKHGTPPSKRKTQTPTKAEQSQLLDLSRKAEFSLLLDLSKPLPESNETATEAEESQPLDLSMKAVNNPPLDPLQDLPESKPQPNDDHSYALPCSPTLIKARLSDALNRVEILEQENLNAKAREQRAKKYIERLLDDLKRKNLTNT
ncbi:uncharacterized protein LOC119786492 [Cyprinodon tularosa]|uniref:uncharacterized protein LOC119786492 n=1 Tax=Cyprinodon tularosa TaxID=77115 RepID=UPI0018E2424A|nr:uncharacterized protein LOC119786492 [Cyprinodon tularosa]